MRKMILGFLEKQWRKNPSSNKRTGVTLSDYIDCPLFPPSALLSHIFYAIPECTSPSSIILLSGHFHSRPPLGTSDLSL
jgi:hypothetical protein